MFLPAEGTDSMIKASEREWDARDEDRDANVRELQQLIAIDERTRVQTRAVRTAYSLSHPFFRPVTIREKAPSKFICTTLHIRRCIRVRRAPGPDVGRLRLSVPVPYMRERNRQLVLSVDMELEVRMRVVSTMIASLSGSSSSFPRWYDRVLVTNPNPSLSRSVWLALARGR